MNIRILAASTAVATCIVAAGQPSHAISIIETADPFALANTLFLNVGNQPGTNPLFIQGATLNGAFGQAGTFTNASGTYGLPPSGIVLSSGNVNDYADGPNLFDDNTTDFGFDGEFGEGEDGNPATEEQNAILSGISGQSDHFDVVELDISFFADGVTDSISFFAAFGSEEFPEFQNSGVNDSFGLIINGTNVASVFGAPVNIDNPDFLPFAGTELDGLLAPGGNPVLRFDVPVNAGAVNDFKVILADAGDGILDTTVYLSSFFAEGPTNNPGENQFNPLLPVNAPDPETGEFIIEIPGGAFDPDDTIWIDPPVAVGYTYSVDPGLGIAFDEIIAPSLATVPDLDGYFITVGATTVALASGATLDVLAEFGAGVFSFELTGIDPALMLDPSDPLAFPVGVSFTSLPTVPFSVSVTPIVEDIGGTTPIPLPASALLYLAALGLAGGALRRSRT